MAELVVLLLSLALLHVLLVRAVAVSDLRRRCADDAGAADTACGADANTAA
jgi:hypothetical protein